MHSLKSLTLLYFRNHPSQGAVYGIFQGGGQKGTRRVTAQPFPRGAAGHGLTRGG